MTRRLEFGKADIHYLANLCHNCGACLHACQYAPPHEFAVNVPRAMAQVRGKTYVEYAWPRALRHPLRAQRPDDRAGARGGPRPVPRARRRAHGAARRPTACRRLLAVFPRPAGVDVRPRLPVRVHRPRHRRHALLARHLGRSRHAARRSARRPPARSACAISTAATADGCNDEDDAFTLRRRRFHHLTFYGFLLCFAATVVATLYHYLLGLRGALSAAEPAGRARHARRHRPARSARRACSGFNLRRDPAHREDSQNAHRPRLHRPALPDQRDRTRAAAAGATAAPWPCCWRSISASSWRFS